MSDYAALIRLTKPELVNLAYETGLYPSPTAADVELKPAIVQKLVNLYREAEKLKVAATVLAVLKAADEAAEKRAAIAKQKAEAEEAEVQQKAKVLLSAIETAAVNGRPRVLLTSRCTTQAEVAAMRKRRRKNNQARFKNRNRPRSAYTAGPEPLPSPVYVNGVAYAFTKAERRAAGVPWDKLHSDPAAGLKHFSAAVQKTARLRVSA